jgi:hypothetical protein
VRSTGELLQKLAKTPQLDAPRIVLRQTVARQRRPAAMRGLLAAAGCCDP